MKYCIRIVVSIILIYVSAINARAQAIINGKAPAYIGKEITLYTYADYISNVEIPVATEVVSDSGLFSFTFEAKEITRVLLKSGKQQASMYIQPNTIYTIFFPSRDTLRFPNPETNQTVNLSFLITDSTEINALIIDYNEQFQKFWDENFQYFVLKKSKSKLDSFETSALAYYAKKNNTYLNNYIRYSIADMELSTFRGKAGLFKNNILNKPIQYNHYEYMQFIKHYFANFLKFFAAKKEGKLLYDAINQYSSKSKCMELLANDKLLRNDTLRELVLLSGLSELYYSGEFKKESIQYILSQIAEDKSTITEHQLIAQNILKSFSKLQPGEQAPNFILLDKNGKEISLTELNKKYIYLNFWATWCTSCLQELKLIPNLKKKFGDKITFVSISIDEDTLAFKKFMAANPKYDWIFLHYANQKNIKELYQVSALPSYFLIDPKNRFVQSPALKPTQSIEPVFGNIKRRGK